MFSPDLAYIFLQHLNNQQISDFFKKKIVDVYAIARITSRETRRRKKKECLIFPGAISATSYIWNLADALQTILAHTMKILLCYDAASIFGC